MKAKINDWTFAWASNNHYGVHHSANCPSTNDWAKNDAFSNDNKEELLTVYLADTQSAGRGRGSNTWSQGVPGMNLLSSWSLQCDTALQPHHSALIGLSIYRAAHKTWPDLPFSLKAPNDLYLKDKKVAGILIEIVTQGNDHRVIVGLGMNVYDAPSDIETAGSLQSFKATLNQGTWETFLERLTFNLIDLVSNVEAQMSEDETSSLLEALNKNPVLTEKLIRVEKDGSLVSPDGATPWSAI